MPTCSPLAHICPHIPLGPHLDPIWACWLGRRLRRSADVHRALLRGHYSREKLRFTGPLLPEAMLLVRENIVALPGD